MRNQARKKLDTLFLCHMVSALACGLICVIKPRWFLLFLHETLPMNTAGYEVSETIIRLYGSLIFAQAWLVKNTRESSDAKVRKSFVEAYAVAFGLTTLVLLYAQYVEHFSRFNWLNVIFFMSLCAGYSYFVFIEKISTFSLGNGEEQ